MPKGKGPLRFGAYEFLHTINWWTLVWMLLAAAASFAATHVIPALEGAGGTWTIIASTLLVPALRAVQQWLADNTQKRA